MGLWVDLPNKACALIFQPRNLKLEESARRLSCPSSKCIPACSIAKPVRASWPAVEDGKKSLSNKAMSSSCAPLRKKRTRPKVNQRAVVVAANMPHRHPTKDQGSSTPKVVCCDMLSPDSVRNMNSSSNTMPISSSWCTGFFLLRLCFSAHSKAQSVIFLS